ncbi:hypothetical protein K26_29695, partial [Klebsiella pneumoniae]
LQLIAEKTQIACHDVKGDEGTSMADMTEIVNGNTTHVHADFPGMDRFKFLFLARQCIKILTSKIPCRRVWVMKSL